MSAGKVLIGIVIAMATGAALGMLFAPGRGSHSRKMLSKQGSRYLDELEKTLGDYLDTLEMKLDSVKAAAIELPDKVEGAVDIFAGRTEDERT